MQTASWKGRCGVPTLMERDDSPGQEEVEWGDWKHGFGARGPGFELHCLWGTLITSLSISSFIYHLGVTAPSMLEHRVPL